MNPKNLLSFVLLAASASAKTVFTELAINGDDQGWGTGVRVPTSNDPIKDVTSNDIICNANPMKPLSKAVVHVVAGDQITAHFHRFSQGPVPPLDADSLAPENKGPVFAYLASTPSATQTKITGLNWFKIWEDTYNTATHQWGSDKLYIAEGNATFTIPSCIAPGQYLLRAEAIGLINATQYPGAEFYMSCAQLQVTESGDKVKKPKTVSFPGAYKKNDAGIVTSIHTGLAYVSPGPAVFKC